MRRPPILFLPLLMLWLSLASCQTCQFYQQAIQGQLEIFRKSRTNSQVCADPACSPELRRQLTAVEGIRHFASDFLLLPGTTSYGKYADLKRQHVVWVLYAAPEFSLKAKTWNYPAVGKMDYRGYFHEQDSIALSGQLKSEGYDVFIGGVDAYSSLGWFHDPILNTFVNYPDLDLAETIFHELTHRKVFHPGDTVFNESLANMVAEEGVKRWLQHQGQFAEFQHYQTRLQRRREFYQEIDLCRRNLETLYASGQAATTMRFKKMAILSKLRDQLGKLRCKWGGRGLESWLHENLNNGHIVSLKIYAEQVPTFQNLLKDCAGNLELFFEKADHLKFSKHSTDPKTP